VWLQTHLNVHLNWLRPANFESTVQENPSMKSSENLSDTLKTLQGTLQQMGRWGCRGFDPLPETLSILQRWGRPVVTAEKGLENLSVDSVESLEGIQAHLADCQRCALAAGRTHIVFGDGHAQARLVFVGEGPGADEDRQGVPFVGAAGQLLNKIIEAMKLSRGQVYICNVIKCRPPNNRNPEPDEIAACRPFLERQLAAIAPEVICTLGTFATQTLLDTDQSISRLRGRFHTYKDAKVMPTFHPAYLLRHTDQKRAVWEDMKKILALLRIPL
jgi:uracil-DNA glycosylase